MQVNSHTHDTASIGTLQADNDQVRSGSLQIARFLVKSQDHVLCWSFLFFVTGFDHLLAQWPSPKTKPNFPFLLLRFPPFANQKRNKGDYYWWRWVHTPDTDATVAVKQLSLSSLTTREVLMQPTDTSFTVVSIAADTTIVVGACIKHLWIY